MTFKRILIATDFSDLARFAVSQGAALAQHHKAEMLLVHVIENSWYAGTYGLGPVPMPDFEKEIRAAADARMAKLQAEAVPAGVSCRAIIREGTPWAEIAAAATEEKADLIVVATHGYTGIKHALLGSQAERIVRAGTCSVLVVRPK